MNPTNAETMRCPTCRAVQEWSDTCRRCKCDLRLLRDLAAEFSARRSRCLWNLQQNRTRAALNEARQCVALRADADSRRLLAVCELLNENFSAALAIGEQLLAAEAARQET